MNSDLCPHKIEWAKPCPWCGRTEAVHFPIRKPWQIYESAFTHFVRQFNHEAVGPLSIVVAVQDLNGKIYKTSMGPKEATVILLDVLLEDLEKNA